MSAPASDSTMAVTESYDTMIGWDLVSYIHGSLMTLASYGIDPREMTLAANEIDPVLITIASYGIDPREMTEAQDA